MSVSATLARRIASAAAAARRLPNGPRLATMDVAADVDAAMMASAAALRRLGARVTRYDVDAGTVEARDARGGALIVVRSTAMPDGITRLEIETAGASARELGRRFRAALTGGPEPR